ncbi:MAG: protein-L-isoaspartate(D-aspartate) O-methyltransferase [Deferribacteraceae bacterium]|jgi:protein-L-isoaspartate(D-aspartate) O-methyltransferase|nr:protein-L-isoaspartate(D-aspartate) O-methyltransferase [Deferribacteraceae bacterium]
MIPAIFLNTVIAPACGNDTKILSAFASIDRAFFLPEPMRHMSYVDKAIPIGYAQSISQPSLVAYMLKELNCGEVESCLEIGAGSGFVTSLLSKLVKYVYAVELRPELAEGAREKIRSLYLSNVKINCGDGTQGWDKFAPYDRIIVSAGAKSIPEKLTAQLKDGGIMIIPLNNTLTKVEKKGGALTHKPLTAVAFVDFVGT